MPYQYIPQNMFQQMYQQPQQAQPQQFQMNVPNLIGRMVASREEALGVPVDFSGQPMIFPDLSHSVIYVKQFNTSTGGAEFKEYQLRNENSVEYATKESLDELIKQIDEIKSGLMKGRAKTNVSE